MRIVDEGNWLQKDHPIGHIWWQASVPDISPTFVDTHDIDEWAHAQEGNWSAIISTDENLWIVTDPMRSFPILHTYQDGEWLVSSSVQQLRPYLKNWVLDEVGAEQFRHAGFTLGTRTLIRGVETLLAGYARRLDADGETLDREIFAHYRSDTWDRGEDAFVERFDELLHERFQALLRNAGDRQLLVPLSGGADSRLVLRLLRDVGATNVVAFTYGTRGSTEATLSREVAQAFGYSWVFVEIDPDEISKQWVATRNRAFLEVTFTADGLTHIQDWYALGKLREHPRIEPGAVVLPGHTVVGNEHDDWCFDPALDFTLDEMVTLVTKHHGILQNQPEEFENLVAVESREQLLPYWASANPHMRSRLTAVYNTRSRQAKYISNSVRAYEYFGFTWAMPMLEHTVWELWLHAPETFHDSARKHYIEYVNRLSEPYLSTVGKYYQAPFATPTGPRKAFREVLERTGLLAAARRVYETHAQLHHPMAFAAFIPPKARRSLMWELLRGRHLLGIYADLMLTNRWVPGADVVPPRI